MGIAATFLARGFEVGLLGRDFAITQAKCPAIHALASTIGPVDAHGSLEAGLIDKWDDWRNVDLVIETISEHLASKQALFANLDQRVPDDIPIGTNSSGFGVDEMTANLKTSHRMMNVHYSMPAHIVPMVEVALGSKTSPAMATSVCALIGSTGKKTTLIKQYIPGLLITRLQHALMREALSLIDQGIVEPADIDAAVRFGFGFRFAALGPVEQKEMSGWDTHYASAQSVYPTLTNVTSPPPCLEELVKRGRIGMKSGAGFREWTLEETTDFKQKYEQRLQAAYAVLNVAPD